MFRLASFSDDNIDELYAYLSSTASRVIYNALDIWGGSLPAVLDIYLTEFAGPPIGENETDFFEGIAEYISSDVIQPEISAMVNRIRKKGFEISEDGQVGMELLERKIERMKEKMEDPDNYYTFDLFEEFLFAKMLDCYSPEIFAGEEDPYVITSDAEVKASAEKLLNEFKIGEELEKEVGETGIGKEYASWLARTIHRVDQMSLWASEESGYESLYFWDADYELVFSGTFVEGIRGLVSGSAAMFGYAYKNVLDIFSDIGIKAPIRLVGTETAFNTVGEISRETMRIENPFDEGFVRDEEEDYDDEDLPFS